VLTQTLNLPSQTFIYIYRVVLTIYTLLWKRSLELWKLKRYIYMCVHIYNILYIYLYTYNSPSLHPQPCNYLSTFFFYCFNYFRYLIWMYMYLFFCYWVISLSVKSLWLIHSQISYFLKTT
jgi:hypothetical protein